MAAELKEQFPEAEVRLVPSSGGVFEVTVDGNLIYSKRALRRHPEPGEVLKLIPRSS